MHSMTNLAVVNISYLKFSSNVRGIMDADRECAAAAIAIAVICKKRKRRIKNNSSKKVCLGQGLVDKKKRTWVRKNSVARISLRK